MRQVASLWTTALLAALPAMHCIAQSFPAKPVRIIVPVTAGGPTDVLARAHDLAMGGELEQR